MSENMKLLDLYIGERHVGLAVDLVDASRLYQKLRDASGKGASEFPEGRVLNMRISYNGRIWLGDLLVLEGDHVTRVEQVRSLASERDTIEGMYREAAKTRTAYRNALEKIHARKEGETETAAASIARRVLETENRA